MGYRWDAEDYACNATAQYGWATELIEKLDLEGGERLLDVGCGDGRVTAELATRLPRGNVLGIDASAEMIAAAQQTYASATYGNLRFSHMDARGVCLQGHFDVAFSNAVLHWVDDHNAVLSGLRSALNTGGRLLFQMGGYGNAKTLFKVLNEVIDTPAWRDFFTDFAAPYHFYSVEDYERWLPDNGFEPLRIELIPKVMNHVDSRGIKGWFRTTWFPYTDRLPKDLRETFIDQVIERYLIACPAAADGTTSVAMVRLEVEAVAV